MTLLNFMHLAYSVSIKWKKYYMQYSYGTFGGLYRETLPVGKFIKQLAQPYESTSRKTWDWFI